MLTRIYLGLQLTFSGTLPQKEKVFGIEFYFGAVQMPEANLGT